MTHAWESTLHITVRRSVERRDSQGHLEECRTEGGLSVEREIWLDICMFPSLHLQVKRPAGTEQELHVHVFSIVRWRRKRRLLLTSSAVWLFFLRGLQDDCVCGFGSCMSDYRCQCPVTSCVWGVTTAAGDGGSRRSVSSCVGGGGEIPCSPHPQGISVVVQCHPRWDRLSPNFWTAGSPLASNLHLEYLAESQDGGRIC